MKVLIGEYRDDDLDREIDVTIDNYDIWSLDHTLAYIIHPALILLKSKKNGSPNVDDDDVPDHLKSTSAPPKKNEWDTDENWFKRWDWVMDEMIWSFSTKIDIDHDKEFYSGTHDIQFVKLAILQEREACAGLRKEVELQGKPSRDYEDGFWDGLQKYEDLIRARSSK